MKATSTDPREAIVERLAAGTPDYSIDFDFARHFAALTCRPETSVLSNLRELAQHYERVDVSSKRGKYARAIRFSCESIWDWFQAGERGEFNSDDVISFIESHCQQCVWAVLLGEKQVRLEHPGVFDELNNADERFARVVD